MGTLLAVLASFLIGEGPAAAVDEDDTPSVQRIAYIAPADAPAQQPTSDDAQPAAPHDETWLGEIRLPGMTLAFSITITPDGDGWSGTIDIPAQGVEGLALRDIRRDRSTLAFGAALQGLPEANWPNWELTLAEDGANAEGVLRQSGQAFPTMMRRGDAGEIAPNRPQHPTGDLPYRASAVTVPVRTDAGEHTLAGTLVLPDPAEFGPGPYPAAILLTGSGPQDRDETLLGHKPFLVLADHLARHGIASLRCDDRGTAGSTGSFEGATSLDFVDDALAQIAFLESRDAVGSIGLVGHSEGGLVAPIAAADNDAVDWLVLLAAPGVPGRAVLGEQLTAIYRADHGIRYNAVLDAMVVAQQAAFDAVLNDDASGARLHLSRLVELQHEAAGDDPDAHRDEIEQGAAAALDELTGPWFRTFLALDPREALRRVRQPVLVLNGSLDTQVLAEQNVHEIRDALAEAGNTRVTVRVLEGLNHLFQPATTGGLTEYGLIETTFDEAALLVISDWIRALSMP